MAKPSAFSLWFAGAAGGLIGGSAVGVAEAGWVLTSTTPSEYQAVLYGAVIYGVIGSILGAGIGFANVVLGALGRERGPGPALGWCFGFFGTMSALGLVIVRYILNKQWYMEAGVPMTTTLGVAGALGAFSLVGIWLGRNLLTKTPLRVLPAPKGTFAVWGAGTALTWMLSLAPAPGAVGAEVPHHPQEGVGPRPNVILFHMDALRVDALGVYSGDAAASPNLDAFAKDAVVFEQNITAASWTRASTASLFTSLSPSSHACETKDSALSPDVVTLAEALGGANYATSGFPNNANVTGALGFGQGFDWYPYLPEYPLGAKESSYSLSMYSLARKVYAKISTKKRVEDYYMPAETQLARASSWIDAQGADRWFTYIHIMEAHDPYFSHPITGEAYGRAEFPNPDPALKEHLHDLYRGEVKHADEEIGRFFGQLKADGLYDNALIIVTADHGEEFFEHGGWWHGTTLYDEQVHVPLLVKLPNNARAGTRVPWQVREIDIAATIADVAGVPKPETWDGETLFADDFDQQLAVTLPPPPADAEGAAGAEAVAAAPPWIAPSWWQLPSSRAALSEQDFEGYDLQSLRADGKKLIQANRVPAANDRKQPPEAFYDLTVDAGEQVLVTGDASVEGLRARLQESVDIARAKGVGAVIANMSDADRARLIQLGYLQGEDAEKK